MIDRDADRGVYTRTMRDPAHTAFPLDMAQACPALPSCAEHHGSLA